MEKGKEYYAFISYKREDEKWARWVQEKLEHYKFPTNLNGRTDLPKNIRPTFRDVTDLKPGLLAEEINNALCDSEWLIVICSPRSAKSPWVCKEAQTFIDLGRADHIIPFVIEGNPFSDDTATECYPEALLKLTGSKELLAVSINEMGKDAAIIKVVARMFGIRFDTLWQRWERERKRKNLLKWIFAIISFLICLVVFFYVYHQAQVATIAQQKTDFFKCEKLFNENKYVDSFNECKRVLTDNISMTDTIFSKFEYLLRMSYDAILSDTLKMTNRYSAEFPAPEWGDMSVVFCDEGNSFYIACNGFTEINGKTGHKIIGRPDLWPANFRIIGDKIYAFDDYEIALYDRRTLKKISGYKLSTGHEDYQKILGASVDGKRFLTRSAKNEYRIYDSNSGHLIRSFTSKASRASINYNGTIIAFSENDKLILYRVETGEKINEYNDLYAADLQFDQSGKWLLLYLEKYDALNVLNLDTKENYSVDTLDGQWVNSFNGYGDDDSKKYIVSDDDRYIAIGSNVYDMKDGTLLKRLREPEQAIGLKIFPGAKKIIQVNMNQEIIVYTRQGKPIFNAVPLDFSKLREQDKTAEKFDIETDDNGNIKVKKKNGHLLGKVTGINGDIYQLSISPDEKYMLISSLAIPTSLFYLPTGQLIQSFPFETGDGDLGIGLFGENGKIYFNSVHSVFEYTLIPLSELLNQIVYK